MLSRQVYQKNLKRAVCGLELIIFEKGESQKKYPPEIKYIKKAPLTRKPFLKTTSPN
jgi:hypothetical protein